MTSEHVTGADRRSLRWSLASSGTLVLAVMSLVAYLIWSGYREAIRIAETTSSNYAAIIESRLDSTLRRADAELLELTGEIPAAALSRQAVSRYAGQMNARLDLSMIHFQELAGLRVFDAEGNQLYSSDRAHTPLSNVADRDYFRQSRDDPNAGLVLSEVTIARTTGRSALIAGRALRDRSGIFRGIAIALVELDYFRKLFQPLDFGARGVVAIYRSDNFNPVVRWPAFEGRFPSMPPGTPARMAIEAGKKAGTSAVASFADGVERVYSFNRLDRYPFFVTAGIAYEDVVAGWRSRSLAVGLSGLMLLLLLAGMLIRLWHAEHRQVEVMTRLRESVNRFRVLFENAGVGVAQMELGTGRIVNANRKYAEILGYERNEITKKSYRDITHPEDIAGAAGRMKRFHDGKLREYSTEKRYIRKDGTTVWANVTISPMWMRGETPGHYIAVIEDITGRKAFEERLILIGEQLSEAQRLAKIGSWEHDLTTGTVIWSDEIFRLFEIGKTKFGATYEAFLNAVHPRDRDAVNAAYTGSLKDRKPYEIKHRLLMADGRIKWVHERCETDFDAEGKPLRSVGTVQDITALHDAEEERRIASIAFESQVAMMITDAQGTILRVNQSFTETTGYGAEEVVGRTPRMLKSGRHDAAFYEEMWASIESTGFWQGEIWDRHKSGNVFPVWLVITAVKSEGGTITHYVGSHTDISMRKATEDRINNLVFYDPLTGLPNRRLLRDRLGHLLARGARNRRHGAIMFLDLDNFKTLNDTQGHALGDQMLIEVARRLQSSVRQGDTVARLGGDEFVVMLDDLDGEDLAIAQTETVAAKILETLNQPYRLESSTSRDGRRIVPYHGSASIGITLFGGDGENVDELLRRADLAMYRAKAAGRNTLRFFDLDMQAAITARSVLEADLREGMQEQQFLLHYQAQVDSANRLIGVEALVRWRHPQRGLVLPGDFIPLAEETGVILPLGYWVLKAACVQLVSWAACEDTAHLTLAVNVSARQFRDKTFVEQVLAVLDLTGANPKKLKFELTESLLLDDVGDAIAKMSALKAHGVGFSLDDFGTGYSSLSYLKRLPLDQLKIDRSFVRDVLSDPNDAAIARTIVALGQSLGLAVIAEGVETEAQKGFLAGIGCHAYQGYLFGRPGEVEDLTIHSTARMAVGQYRDPVA